MIRRRTSAGFTLIELMIVLVIIAILASIMIPNFQRSRAQGRMSACKSNLRNIATALETYVSENGTLPTALNILTPQYINSIPTCPGAGADSYSAGYEQSNTPTAYTVLCTGVHHADLGPPNYPQFFSSQGLVSP